MSYTTNTTAALEEFENGKFGTWLRLSVERMAFTSRGRFAFLVGALITLLFWQDSIIHQGVARSDVLVNTTYAPWLQITGQFINGVLLTAGLVLAGALVLLVMDIYESELGLLIETDDEGGELA